MTNYATDHCFGKHYKNTDPKTKYLITHPPVLTQEVTVLIKFENVMNVVFAIYVSSLCYLFRLSSLIGGFPAKFWQNFPTNSANLQQTAARHSQQSFRGCQMGRYYCHRSWRRLAEHVYGRIALRHQSG